jgi:hypothetical protein
MRIGTLNQASEASVLSSGSIRVAERWVRGSKGGRGGPGWPRVTMCESRCTLEAEDMNNETGNDHKELCVAMMIQSGICVVL